MARVVGPQELGALAHWCPECRLTPARGMSNEIGLLSIAPLTILLAWSGAPGCAIVMAP